MLTYDTLAQSPASTTSMEVARSHNMNFDPNSLAMISRLFPNGLTPPCRTNEAMRSHQSFNVVPKPSSAQSSFVMDEPTDPMLLAASFGMQSSLLPLGLHSYPTTTGSLQVNTEHFSEHGGISCKSNEVTPFSIGTSNYPRNLFDTETSQAHFDIVSQSHEPKVTLMNELINALYVASLPGLENAGLKQNDHLKNNTDLSGIYHLPSSTQGKSDEDFCELCQKHFCNKYYLRKHKADVHGIHMEPYSYGRRKEHGTHSSRSSELSETDKQERMTMRKVTQQIKSGETISRNESSMQLAYQNGFCKGETRLGENEQLLAATQSETNPLDVVSKLFNPPIYPMLNFPGIISSGFNPTSVDAIKEHASDPMAFLSNSEVANDLDVGGVRCEECGKVFCNQYFLNIHKLQNHSFQSRGHYVARSPNKDQASPGGYTKISSIHTKRPSESPTHERDNGAPSSTKVGRLPEKGVKSSLSTLDAFKSSMVAAKLADRVTCELCKKELCNKYFLRTHKIRVHGISPKDVGGPPMRNPPTVNLTVRSSGQTNQKINQSDTFSTVSHLSTDYRDLQTETDACPTGSPSNFMENISSYSPGIGKRILTHGPEAVDGSIVNRESVPSSTFPSSNDMAETQKLFSMANIISCPICEKTIGPRLFLPSHLNDIHGLNPINPNFFLTMLQARVVSLKQSDGTSLLTDNEIRTMEENNTKTDNVLGDNNPSTVGPWDEIGTNESAKRNSESSEAVEQQVEDYHMDLIEADRNDTENSSFSRASVHSESEMAEVESNRRKIPSESNSAISSRSSGNVGETLIHQDYISPGGTYSDPNLTSNPTITTISRANINLPPANQDLLQNQMGYPRIDLCNQLPFLSTINMTAPFPITRPVQTSGLPHGAGLPRKSPNQMRVLCDICNKWICNKYFLRTHKANKHGINDPSQQGHTAEQTKSKSSSTNSGVYSSSNTYKHTVGANALNTGQFYMDDSSKANSANFVKPPALITETTTETPESRTLDPISLAWKLAYDTGLHTMITPAQLLPYTEHLPLPINFKANALSNFDGIISNIINPTSTAHTSAMGPTTGDPETLGKSLDQHSMFHTTEDRLPLNLSLKNQSENEERTAWLQSTPEAVLTRKSVNNSRWGHMRKSLIRAKMFKHNPRKIKKTFNPNMKKVEHTHQHSRAQLLSANRDTETTSNASTLELWSKNFICPICPDSSTVEFTTLNTLLQHLTHIHGREGQATTRTFEDSEKLEDVKDDIQSSRMDIRNLNFHTTYLQNQITNELAKGEHAGSFTPSASVNDEKETCDISKR